MSRNQTPLMQGWLFAFGQREHMPQEADFIPVSLPHDWVVARSVRKDAPLGTAQGFFTRNDVGWYKLRVKLEKGRAYRRTFLDFGGVYENSTVWVNGAHVGGHGYGYTPFRLEITDAVCPGDNEIVVRVDCTAEPADRWYSGCGIYRTVHLIETGEDYIDEREVVVTTEVAADSAKMYVNLDQNAAFRVRLLSPNGKTVADADGVGRLSLCVARPALWSSDAPNLYTLTLQLLSNEQIVDEVSLRVGLRNVHLVPNKGLFVNGQHTVLKGVCVHQDVSCVGIAATKELWRERLLALKAIGCNSIRPAHHVYSAEFMDLCDELGFYVYEECFDKWHSGLYQRYFDADWQADVDAMIKRDRNRPCVLMWGIGNEVENQGQNDVMLATLRQLTDYARSLDPTRPVTYAMNPHYKRADESIDFSKVKDIQKLVDEVDDREITDFETRLDCICEIASCVDIISCNYQEQWYDAIHERMPDKLILGTELYQYFKGHRDKRANYCEEVPSLVPLNTPYVIGGMIWSGYDYLGESCSWPSKGWTGALMRTNGSRRASSAMLQSYWSDEPMLQFFALDYTLPDENTKEHWAMPPYERIWDFPHIRHGVVPYLVATNCERVEITLGRDVFLLPKPADCPNRLITGFLPYFPGKLEARGYIADKLVCTDVLVTPGNAAGLRLAPHAQCYPAKKGYKMLLTVQAVDANGNDVLREGRTVAFSVEGPASVYGTDNGDMAEHTPYTSSAIPLWRGQASVMLSLNGSVGDVIVRAYADGLTDGQTVLQVR